MDSIITDDATATTTAFDELDHWITQNGWAGYDPYDIRGQGWYVKLFGAWLPGKVRTALYILERSLPQQALRRVLGIKKAINAKGMGLLASAYLTRYQTCGDKAYLIKAQDILEWLRDNRVTDYPGASWGYPFHWQSRQFFSRGTPSVVVTGTVADAFIAHYEITGDATSLMIANEVATFFTQALNRSVDTERHLCFSYTPKDQFKVLNASLFAAAFFARLERHSPSNERVDMAVRAARYILSQQNDDGSFYYWGDEPPTAIDHYHTGFVLRHLDTIRRLLNADFIDAPLRRGYEFYVARMFDQRGVPKHTPEHLYPINIHSCAEALLCLTQLGERYGHADKALAVQHFAREHMLTPQGWYVGHIRKSRGRDVRAMVPFMRWAQAWMLLAYARYEHSQLTTNTATRT